MDKSQVDAAIAELLPASKAVRQPSSQEARERNIEAERLLLNHNELMLYKASEHGSLMMWSIISGSSFSTMALTTASGIMTGGGQFSLWLQVPTLCGCVLGLAMGINMLITTMRTLQSIRLIRTPEKEIKLRFESKWRAYFWQPKYNEVALDQVATDRNIRDVDVLMANIDFKDRFEWTKWEDEHPPAFNLSRILRSMGQGVANGWSVMKRDVGRMFLRQGMMIVRIGDQNWKMDMWRAELLDRGTPLSNLIRTDMEIQNSVVGIIRRQLSGT